MELIKLNDGQLRLAGEGRERLEREQPTNWTPVYRPWGRPTKA